MTNLKPVGLAAAALLLATALTAAVAGPASAADAPPPTPNAAFQAWLDSPPTTQASPATHESPATSATSNASPAAVKSTNPTGGERITETHGGPLLWTSNTLEWYFTSSKITSSSGSQADGYIFPNTASKGGIKRTLKTSTQHNWRGIMVVGEGTVTPWGNVNLFKTSQTDYFELLLKGKYELS